ncbi:hypothetical protein CQ060_18815 [Ochrobactrum sp. MYb237]|nr:hypothetical protein F9K82_16895 [Brucella pseudogrignonensis]MQP42031.1 hypothetical protein [Ochrobactrum sp. MYb237]
MRAASFHRSCFLKRLHNTEPLKPLYLFIFMHFHMESCFALLLEMLRRRKSCKWAMPDIGQLRIFRSLFRYFRSREPFFCPVASCH